MTQKILMLLNSCGECPSYKYRSGGRYECSGIGEIVQDKNSIAPFCPLPDFPSRTLANMDVTIRTLREPNKYGLVLAILSHIATKLNLLLNSDGMVAIELKNGESIQLRHDGITEISTYPYAVHFVFGDRSFKLEPDGKTPPNYLREVLSRDLMKCCGRNAI